jgi:hypothetical protein
LVVALSSIILYHGLDDAALISGTIAVYYVMFVQINTFALTVRASTLSKKQQTRSKIPFASLPGIPAPLQLARPVKTTVLQSNDGTGGVLQERGDALEIKCVIFNAQTFVYNCLSFRCTVCCTGEALSLCT